MFSPQNSSSFRAPQWPKLDRGLLQWVASTKDGPKGPGSYVLDVKSLLDDPGPERFVFNVPPSESVEDHGENTSSHWLCGPYIGDSKLRLCFLTFYKSGLKNNCFFRRPWFSLFAGVLSWNHILIMVGSSAAFEVFGFIFWSLSTYHTSTVRCPQMKGQHAVYVEPTRQFVRPRVSPREAMHWSPRILFIIYWRGDDLCNETPVQTLSLAHASPFQFSWAVPLTKNTPHRTKGEDM